MTQRRYSHSPIPTFGALVTLVAALTPVVVIAQITIAPVAGRTSTPTEVWRTMAMAIGSWALRGYGMWACERIDVSRISCTRRRMRHVLKVVSVENRACRLAAAPYEDSR